MRKVIVFRHLSMVMPALFEKSVCCGRCAVNLILLCGVLCGGPGGRQRSDMLYLYIKLQKYHFFSPLSWPSINIVYLCTLQTLSISKDEFRHAGMPVLA